MPTRVEPHSSNENSETLVFDVDRGQRQTLSSSQPNDVSVRVDRFRNATTPKNDDEEAICALDQEALEDYRQHLLFILERKRHQEQIAEIQRRQRQRAKRWSTSTKRSQEWLEAEYGDIQTRESYRRQLTEGSQKQIQELDSTEAAENGDAS